jgi:spore germination protein GerM
MVKTQTLIWRIVLGALVLLLVASIFVGLRVLRRLPNTVVYFVKSEDTHFVLEPVFRSYPKGQELTSALEDLIRAPNSRETTKNLFSALPAQTQIINLKTEGDRVTVNFSKDFIKEDGLASHQSRLNQVWYTLSQPKDFNSVSILIEGQPLTMLGGEGLIVENPWIRNDKEVLPEW